MKGRKPDPGDGRQRFLFLGNHLALDFVNTELMEHGQRVDRLRTARDLAAWLQQAGIAVSSEGATRGGARLLRRAKVLRAALRRMAEGLAAGRAVPAAVIPAINRELRGARSFQELTRTATGFQVNTRSGGAVSALLGPIAQSAAELLAGDDRLRVRRCGNPACILHFYDTTRSHTRRWCSMAGCGNRMKVAAHYRRRKIGS